MSVLASILSRSTFVLEHPLTSADHCLTVPRRGHIPEVRSMLVISRKLGEQVVIGESILVTVVEAGRGRVRLGIEAPANIDIVRREIQDDPLPASDHTVAAGPRTIRRKQKARSVEMCKR